jgi:hypothetical protein
MEKGMIDLWEMGGQGREKPEHGTCGGSRRIA